MPDPASPHTLSEATPAAPSTSSSSSTATAAASDPKDVETRVYLSGRQLGKTAAAAITLGTSHRDLIAYAANHMRNQIYLREGERFSVTATIHFDRATRERLERLMRQARAQRWITTTGRFKRSAQRRRRPQC